MRRCEDEKVFYRPPLLEEPCAQTLSGKTVCGLSNLVIQFTCSAKLLLYHKICHHRLHIFGTSFSECLPIGYIPPLWCQTRPADHHFDRLQYIFPVRGKRSHFRHFATILAGLHVCIFLWSILRLYHISMYILYIYIYIHIYIYPYNIPMYHIFFHIHIYIYIHIHIHIIHGCLLPFAEHLHVRSGSNRAGQMCRAPIRPPELGDG